MTRDARERLEDIVHEYFRIELARIRDIVERDIPPLRGAIEALIG